MNELHVTLRYMSEDLPKLRTLLSRQLDAMVIVQGYSFASWDSESADLQAVHAIINQQPRAESRTDAQCVGLQCACSVAAPITGESK